jgi:FixJ family two-component response regulator
MRNGKIILYAPSDDIHRLLLDELQIMHFEIQYCRTAEHCLEMYSRGGMSALFIDVDYAKKAAFPLCSQIKKLNPIFPIVIMLSKTDITSAIMAARMKLHFIYEKPLVREQLEPIIKSIQEKHRGNSHFSRQLLTENERKILSNVLAGKTNKQISKYLKKSVRTIEEHRADIMAKLGVDNSVDLVDRAIFTDLLDTEQGAHPGR